MAADSHEPQIRLVWATGRVTLNLFSNLTVMNLFNRTAFNSAKGRHPNMFYWLMTVGVWLIPAAFGAEPLTAKLDRKTEHARAADELFEAIPYVSLRIEIPNPDLNKLRNYYWDRSGFQMDRPEARATVYEGEKIYTNVAVQLKGSAGSFRPIDDRPALTLNFDKFAKGQSFHGLDKVSLNNSVQDESYLSEKIAREIFQSAGVPVPRAGNAIVRINSRRLGVYVLTEGWDGRFLNRYFSNTKGNFYDSGFKRDVSETLEVNSGEHPEDRTAIRQLMRASASIINAGRKLSSEPDEEKRKAISAAASERWKTLGDVLDVERFLRMVVMETITGHWDGYTMNANNYRIFHDLDSGKLVFMPHGMDQMFGSSRRGRDFEGSLLWPRIDGEVTAAVLGTSEGAKRYQQLYKQLFADAFNASRLTNRVRSLATGLRPAFTESGQPGEISNWDWSVRNLCERISNRGHAIEQLLSAMNNTLKFDESGAAPLVKWESKADYGKPVVEATDEEGHKLLKIQANAGGQVGSWRIQVILDQGRYRFEGRAKTRGVNPDPGDSRGGAGLRSLGRAISQKMVGDFEWTPLSHDFAVVEPFESVVLMCELRAGKGEAWFDLDSLRLIRK